MTQTAPDWTRLSPQEVSKKLKTNPQTGLAEKDVTKRLTTYGPNRWAEEKRTSPVVMFLSQFTDPITLILVGALLVSGLILSEWIDAAAIGVILVLNAVLGFVQQYRADRALAALKKLTSSHSRVVRDGRIIEIDTQNLVPGDVVLLSAGDKIPADGRLTDAKHILIDESSLTGESVAVDKQVEALESDTRLLGEKRNMAFLGTTVVKGRGRFIVTTTGSQTQMGKVARSLTQKREKTPLQKDLHKLGNKILFIVLGTCAVVFLVELFKQGAAEVNWLTPLLVAISLAVAAIPEGLPAAVTISLALGVRRMAEQRAIVRRLPAVETLGATTFICTDKTGTLTENRMQVERIIPLREDLERSLLEGLLLCNDSEHSDGNLLGDPTETALVEFAEEKGLNLKEMRNNFPRIDEIAFDSERKMMTTLHKTSAGLVSVTKGAPEMVLERCTNLDPYKRERWYKKCDDLSKQGYRLLGFARKRTTQETVDSSLEEDMEFLGLISESDPPRAEVPAALSECTDAGIKVAMITGDHMATAKTVAKRIGLKGKAVSGDELAGMSDEELYDKIRDIAIFARVSPLQKVRILEALKYHNHVVAMTGDGVNDAPALRRADIGVAMGITGTDVSVEASEMVLTDDNFATIVSAVREGRLIFTNIKKFVHFLLSCNVSEVLTVLLASVLGMPFPLFPIQILWVNLVTDGLPALALGSDKPSGDLMKSTPRARKEGIITQMGLVGIILQGLLLTVGVLGAYAASLYLLPGLIPGWLPQLTAAEIKPAAVNTARTVAFSTLVLSQLLHAFNFRVGKHFLFSPETLRNLYLDGAFLLSLGLHAAVLYFAPVSEIFKTVPLGWGHIIVVVVASIIPVIALNLLRRRIIPR